MFCTPRQSGHLSRKEYSVHLKNEMGVSPPAGFFEYDYCYYLSLANFQKNENRVISNPGHLNGSNLARSGCSVSVVANNWLRPDIGNSFVQNETGPPESDGPKLAAFRNRSQLIP